MSQSIIQDISCESIVPGNNDRQNFEPNALRELAESISQHGLAQPITVRPLPALIPSYEIVAGERRYRAISSILKWATIPCIVKDLNDEEASAIMLVENTGRQDLDPIEEANAYQSRVVRFGWDTGKIAKIAGKSKRHVERRISLLSLADDIQHLVAHGNLPIGHAEAMVKLDNNRQFIALRVFREGRNITLSQFRRIVADLLAEQSQDSLFDLATYYIEQSKVTDKVVLRGKGATVPVPTRKDIPKPKPNGSASSMIFEYIKTLLSSGLVDEAGAIGTMYAQLVHSNKMSLPDTAVSDIEEYKIVEQLMALV